MVMMILAASHYVRRRLAWDRASYNTRMASIGDNNPRPMPSSFVSPDGPRCPPEPLEKTRVPRLSRRLLNDAQHRQADNESSPWLLCLVVAPLHSKQLLGSLAASRWSSEATYTTRKTLQPL